MVPPRDRTSRTTKGFYVTIHVEAKSLIGKYRKMSDGLTGIGWSIYSWTSHPCHAMRWAGFLHFCTKIFRNEFRPSEQWTDYLNCLYYYILSFVFSIVRLCWYFMVNFQLLCFSKHEKISLTSQYKHIYTWSWLYFMRHCGSLGSTARGTLNSFAWTVQTQTSERATTASFKQRSGSKQVNRIK